MTTSYVPKPGRPRQPYCPDCKKENPPRLTQKAQGQGYCKDHQRARVAKNYAARKRETNRNYVHPSELVTTLENDIRSAIASGMPLDASAIQALYTENGLVAPTPEQIDSLFFPDRTEPEMSDEDRYAVTKKQEDAAREALDAFKDLLS